MKKQLFILAVLSMLSIIILSAGCGHQPDYLPENADDSGDLSIFEPKQRGETTEKSAEFTEPARLMPTEPPVKQEDFRFMTAEHYKPEYHERYIKYSEANPRLSHSDVVTYVNIGLDFPFYSEEIKKQVEDPHSYLVLSNKYIYLPESFVPEGYAKTDGRVLSLRGEAQKQFDKMRSDAEKDGISINIISGYRSYAIQREVYNNYKRNDPAGADTYSARPGHSEHQTGLSADINTASSTAGFENTKEYAWLNENAHNYGFILRYPKGKEWITGYIFEPWHWRYIGVETAGKLKESDITLDEYHAIYLHKSH